MRYCSHCGIEYGEEAACCATCSTSELLTGAELQRRRGEAQARGRELDNARLVSVGTTEDPLTAELVSRALDAACIPVFAKDARGGVVDVVTSGVPHDWWEFLVPDVYQSRAAEIVSYALAQLTANPGDAARAAVDEEQEGATTP